MLFTLFVDNSRESLRALRYVRDNGYAMKDDTGIVVRPAHVADFAVQYEALVLKFERVPPPCFIGKKTGFYTFGEFKRILKRIEAEDDARILSPTKQGGPLSFSAPFSPNSVDPARFAMSQMNESGKEDDEDPLDDVIDEDEVHRNIERQRADRRGA